MAQKTVSAVFGFPRSFCSYKQMKEQVGYFFEPQSLTGRKKTKPGNISKFADMVFETKVLKSRRNVCFFLKITSNCTGTEYCK